jgi:Niemann-Pick C1 protein
VIHLPAGLVLSRATLAAMRGFQFTPMVTGLVSGLLLSVVAAQGVTEIHEEGRCAIRGHCGKKGFFGGELPCPDNGLAREPDDAVREKLVALCGDKWAEGPVCCEDEQVRALFVHCWL